MGDYDKKSLEIGTTTARRDSMAKPAIYPDEKYDHKKFDDPPYAEPTFKDIEQQPPPPMPTYTSFPPTTSRHRGRDWWHVRVPLWLVVLFIAVFLLESGILFAYTAIGLYRVTPPVMLSTMGINPQGNCNCAAPAPAPAPQQQAPAGQNIIPPQPSVVTTTMSPTPTPTPTTSSSTTSSSTIATSSAAAVLASIFGGESHSVSASTLVVITNHAASPSSTSSAKLSTTFETTVVQAPAVTVTGKA